MAHIKNQLLQPVLKWAGGKRQLLPEIAKLFPKSFKTYFEPFLGGGAVLFYAQPKKAIVNDFNGELINVYKTIKNNVEDLIKELSTYKNEKEFYYKIREIDRTEEFKKMTNIQKAARVIYLNKTCYNGLFRVNSKGEFNTPFGKYKNPNIVNELVLRAVHKYFNDNEIDFYNDDFENALTGIRKDSFVYFDPPYHPISDSSNFTGYTFGGFDEEDQKRLKKTCDFLNQKGIKFLLSNSSSKLIYDLYKNYNIKTVGATRFINANSDNRGEVPEVLITNYDTNR